MNKIKSILVVITMLTLSSASFADASESLFLTANFITETSYKMGISDAAILFGLVMFVAGAFGRVKRKSKKTLVVGAFTRAS